MPRQIEYDPVALKQNLLSVFWSQGYAETSLTELEAATGLNRRQLYNGVGDKRDMFIQSLDAFCDFAGRSFLAALETEDAGLADIERLLQSFLDAAERSEGPNGCMVCSTSQEEIASDPDVKVRVDAYFDRIRAAYRNTLSRAAARGDVALTDPEIDLRTEALFGTHVALCILGRAGRPHAQLTQMVRQALNDIY